VVGYDDIDMASHAFPPLTTVRQPIELAGGVMVDCLQSLLDGGQPDSQLLPTSLVVRESSLQTSDAQP
jgi:DNA-binding LacI/PurR family transcriptional regulator